MDVEGKGKEIRAGGRKLCVSQLECHRVSWWARWRKTEGGEDSGRGGGQRGGYRPSWCTNSSSNSSSSTATQPTRFAALRPSSSSRNLSFGLGTAVDVFHAGFTAFAGRPRGRW